MIDVLIAIAFVVAIVVSLCVIALDFSYMLIDALENDRVEERS